MKVFCFVLLALAVANSHYIADPPLMPDSPYDVEDPTTWGDKFEGDIVLTEEQERQIMNATERNGMINEARRWPGAVVPYVFNSQFTASEKNTILAALADYAKYTCIKVQERTNEAGYVEFVKQGGCWSYVGYLGRKQSVSLVSGCQSRRGTIIHEIMHALGFFHEQSRTDRDEYVTIVTANIQNGRANNFRKYDSNYITGFGEAYDYGSVMHYSAYAFSKNGQRTIITKDGSAIGQRNGLSQTDINKINKMYSCSSVPTTAPTTTTTTQAPCVNNYSGPDWHCTYWKNVGYCTRTYVSWMASNCAKACSGC